MPACQIAIDTCIRVDVERGAISPADVQQFTREEPVFISPVTIAELTYGTLMAKSAEVRAKRLAALDRLKKKPLLAIDDITGDIFGNIAASLHKEGRRSRHRVQDLWLASQAIQCDCAFLTRKRKGFEDIPGLRLVTF